MPVSPVERNDHSEPNAEAFIFGFDFTPDGAAAPVDWQAVKPTAACPANGWRWLHFNRLASETRDWLENYSGLDEPVFTALLQTESRPRCAVHQDGILLNLRGVNHNPGAEPEDMISVRIWATRDLVVSMRSYPVQAMHRIREETLAGDGPSSPGELLVSIAAKLIGGIEPIIEQLKDEADEFEETMLARTAQVSASDLAEFRRSILIIRRYILPQREAMVQLQRDGKMLFTDDHALALREASDRVIRIAEELDSIRDRAAVLQDQIEAHRQEQLNQRLLVLSIMSALFLPLTFVTGVFGMNLGGIPFADRPWSFAAVVIATGLMAAGLLGYLKLKRWL